MIGAAISGVADASRRATHLTCGLSRLTIRDKNNEAATRSRWRSSSRRPRPSRVPDWLSPWNERYGLRRFAFPSLLREMGQEPAEVVGEAGLDVAMFDDPETTVCFVDASRLLGVCVVRTGCEHFGLLAGQHAGIESLGVVGLIMQPAPDVGTSLREVVLHLQVHDRGAIPTLVAEDDMVELGYSVYRKGAKNTGQIYDITMAMALNLMKSLCGADWLPSQVLFRHAEQTDRGPYRCLFKVPLRFDCDRSALVSPVACLGHPVTGANPVLRRILEAEIEALMERIDMDFVVHFRRGMSGLVITSRAPSE
jgi:hypothetical protein